MKGTGNLQNLLAGFGAAVKSRRNELGITQEELAHRAGLHRTYITDVEGGKRNITIDSILKLATALNVPISDLFARAGKKNMSP